MPFFDFLFGNKKSMNYEVRPDKIWLTTDAKFAGIANEVTKRATTNPAAILLVAHFSDVLARLNEIAATTTTALPVKAVLASNLAPGIADGLDLDPSATIDFLVAERHPLMSADEQLESFAALLPCRCRLAYHLSLDDPLLQAFSGAWVQNVLGKMGMTDDEPIESTMISRRIKDGQRKIESKSFGASYANSAGEWLEKNCPNM